MTIFCFDAFYCTTIASTRGVTPRTNLSLIAWSRKFSLVKFKSSPCTHAHMHTCMHTCAYTHKRIHTYFILEIARCPSDRPVVCNSGNMCCRCTAGLTGCFPRTYSMVGCNAVLCFNHVDRKLYYSLATLWWCVVWCGGAGFNFFPATSETTVYRWHHFLPIWIICSHGVIIWITLISGL